MDDISDSRHCVELEGTTFYHHVCHNIAHYIHISHLYLLTQHSACNQRHHPFILCKCKKGQYWGKTRHQCNKLSQKELCTLYDKSKTVYDDNIRKNSKYTVHSHAEWADEKNFGMTHFGLSPRILDYHNIRFDTFHMFCQITRKLMDNLRRFMNQQSFANKNNFHVLLRNEWGHFNASVWAGNKKLSIYTGNPLKLFIEIIPSILLFLKTNFVKSLHNKSLCEGLHVWMKISNFLIRTKIYDLDDPDEDKEKKTKDYMADINNFKRWVTQLYAHGSITFMKRSTEGDAETFYLHVLRFYMPNIIKQTWEMYGLGVGIFTMQGFEQRNKEAKHSLINHNNAHGYNMTQSLVWFKSKFSF